MGRKRQQQVTGKTFAERVEIAEKSQAFYKIKMIKRWANRSKDKRATANISRSGQKEVWKW